MKPFKFIKDTWDKYSLPIIITIAFCGLGFYYIDKIFFRTFFDTHPNLFKEVFQYATIVLGTGVFLATLKWFQFKGFMRQELHEIINSSEFENKVEKMLAAAFFSEEFLQKQSNLKDIWSRVNHCLFKSEFPDLIAGKIQAKMYETFLANSEVRYYYKNKILSIDVKLEDNNFLTIMEQTETTIVRPNTEKFELKFTHDYVKLNEDDKNSGITYESVAIEGKEIDLSKHIKDEKVGLKGDVILRIELEGKKEYNLLSKIQLKYDIDKDNLYVFYSTRFVDGLRAEISHTANLRTHFQSIGNEEFAETKRAVLTYTKSFQNLLFPDRGFRIIFDKNK